MLTNARYVRFYSVPDLLLCCSLRLYHRFSVLCTSRASASTLQHYGWLFAVNIIGLMAVSMVNRRFGRSPANASLPEREIKGIPTPVL